MTTRPFHHGNLRAVLLERAEVMLRDGGVDALSLRELARHAGVSHGAPRSHFVDRQALLDALAERGFDRLTQKVHAVGTGPAPFEERFRRVGHAYVDFAVDDAALMELMFAAKMDEPSEQLQRAAAQLFTVLDEMLGAPTEETPDDSADATAYGGAPDAAEDARFRFKLLFAATMQGTATLMAARRVSRRQGELLVDDAVDLLLGSELGARVLPGR